MKKKFMLLIIATIMIVTFVSCEGDIFQSISDFMGGTSTNVLIDGEIVSVPTGNIDDLGDTLGGVGEGDVEDPVTPEKAAEVRDSVKKILASKGETEAAKALLKEPVAPADVPDEVKNAMTDLEVELGLEPGELEVKDKGTLAAAILLSDLKKKKDAFVDPANPTPAEKEQLVKDARVIVEFVKKTSPIGDIDVTTALTDLLEGLIDERAMRRMISRGSEDDVDMEEILGYVKPLFNMYYNIINTADEAEDLNKVTSNEVKNIAQQYATLRKAYETMAPSLDGSGQETKFSDLINYLSAVIISANNNLIPTAIKEGKVPKAGDEFYPETTFATILNLAKVYIDSGVTTEPTGDEWFFLDMNNSDIADMWADAFFDYLKEVPTRPVGTTEKRYDTIFNTVLALSRAIPDNTFITGELEDIIDDLRTDIEGE